VRHLVAGLGEIVKYAGLAGDDFLSRFEKYLDHGDLLHPQHLRSLIRLSVQYKADIVARDEREGKLRMVLNLGHTFGHAIEKGLGYGRLLHGEAVILGLDAAVELSRRLKPSRRHKLRPFQQLVRRLYPALPRRKLQAAPLIEAMALDKKRSGNTLRFVLLDAPGRPIISDAVPPAAVRHAVGAMLEHYHGKGVRKDV